MHFCLDLYKNTFGESGDETGNSTMRPRHKGHHKYRVTRTHVMKGRRLGTCLLHCLRVVKRPELYQCLTAYMIHKADVKVVSQAVGTTICEMNVDSHTCE